jgi:TRAP-type C4-dicarboxylate transport system permease small subunit
MPVLQRIDQTVARIEMVLAVIFLGFISFLTALGVFFRYALGDPLDWVVDLSIVLLVWLTFLGAAAVFRSNGHIAASPLPAVIGQPWRTILSVFLSLVIMACAWVMGSYGIDMALVQHNQTIYALMDMPRSIHSIPIIWCSISIGFSVLVRLLSGQIGMVGSQG